MPQEQTEIIRDKFGTRKEILTNVQKQYIKIHRNIWRFSRNTQRRSELAVPIKETHPKTSKHNTRNTQTFTDAHKRTQKHSDGR